MAYNYTVQKNEFDTEWEKLESQLIAAGCDERKVLELKQEELVRFRGERIYEMHNQGFDFDQTSNMDDPNQGELYLICNFMEELSCEIDSLCGMERTSWIDEIFDEELVKKIKTLSERELDILTMWAIEGYSQEDIAYKYGLDQYNVSRIIKKIRKIFTKSA